MVYGCVLSHYTQPSWQPVHMNLLHRHTHLSWELPITNISVGPSVALPWWGQCMLQHDISYKTTFQQVLVQTDKTVNDAAYDGYCKNNVPPVLQSACSSRCRPSNPYPLRSHQLGPYAAMWPSLPSCLLRQKFVRLTWETHSTVSSVVRLIHKFSKSKLQEQIHHPSE